MIAGYRKFALTHPVWFGVTLIVLYSLLTTLTFPVHFLFADTEAGQLLGDAAARLVVVAAFLGLLWRFGWLRQAGLSHVRLGSFWLIVLVLMVYKTLAQLYAFTGSLQPILPATAVASAERAYIIFGVLVEELMVRGLLLIAMVKAWGDSQASVAKSVALSSMLFGLIHLLNLIENPVPLVLLQAMLVSLPGALYAALTLYSRSLWPAILLHAAGNLAVNGRIRALENYQELPTMWLTWLILALPLVAFAAYLVAEKRLGSHLLGPRPAPVTAGGEQPALSQG